MRIRPEVGIFGTGALFMAMGVALQAMRPTTETDVELGFFEITIQSGWALAFVAAAGLIFMWGLFPGVKILYFGSIIACVTAVWSRAIVIVTESHNWIGLLSWATIFWLIINLWPRWKVQIFLNEQRGVEGAGSPYV